MKPGVPNWAATAMAMEWRDQLDPVLADLDPSVMEIEAANLAKHYKRWHVPCLGNVPAQRPDGVFRIMGRQLNSASSTEVHLCKVADMLRVLNNWEVQGGCLLEVGVNWSTHPPLANLASWFRDEIPDMGTHTAHNSHEVVGSHQPGVTASFSCGELVGYMKQRCIDHQGLGRWCSTLFYADFNHRFCIVSAYNVSRQAPRGKSTIFQQQLRYIQNCGLHLTPSWLFMINFIA